MVFLGETRITIVVFIRDSAVFLALYLAGLMWLPASIFLELLNGILCGVCALTIALYAPSLADLWRTGANDLALVRFGISGAWFDQLLQSMARIYFIEFRPEISGRTFDASYGSPAVGYIIFAMLHIIAIGMEGNKFPWRNVHLIGWAVMSGATAVALIKGVHLVAI